MYCIHAYSTLSDKEFEWSALFVTLVVTKIYVKMSSMEDDLENYIVAPQYLYSHILTRSYSIALVSMETTKSPFFSDKG